MQQIAQTLANKGLEAPAQYTAQYFARNFEETLKRNNHGRFQPCTVLLHSIARYCAELRISIHLLCKLLYKRTAQLCMLSNRVVGKNGDFDQKRRYFRQGIFFAAGSYSEETAPRKTYVQVSQNFLRNFFVISC